MEDREYIGDSTFGSEEEREEEAAANKEAAEDTRHELLEQTAKRNNLSEEEIGTFLYESYRNGESEEYLVNGAILTCSMCTKEIIVVEDKAYKVFSEDETDIDKEIHVERYGEKVLKRLSVTENPTSEINGLKYATIKDSVKETNIPFFGNCQRKPDNERELYIFKNHIWQQCQHGTCRYLMNLEKDWENYDIGQSFFDFPDDKYGEKNGITMTSFLFCKHGGFIYPVTSGQEIVRYADYISAGLTVDEIFFIKNFEITEKEKVIFEEIKKYFKDYPELWSENVIFTFEGLGIYSGGTNSDHAQGQFGAIFIYYKNGEPIYMSRNCSTLPDYASSKTVVEGIYSAVYWPHNGTYPTIQLRNDSNESNGQLPVYHYDAGFNHVVGNDTANGINLHAAGKLEGGTIWAKGCLTVTAGDYYQFGIKAGFIEDRKDGNAYETYAKIKTLKFDESMRNEHWGYVVINRKYMDGIAVGEDTK